MRASHEFHKQYLQDSDFIFLLMMAVADTDAGPWSRIQIRGLMSIKVFRSVVFLNFTIAFPLQESAFLIQNRVSRTGNVSFSLSGCRFLFQNFGGHCVSP